MADRFPHRPRAAVLTRIACGVLLLALAACEPVAMIPGGELSGAVKQTPADWSFSDEFEEVQLETRPDDPYSVNVWGVGVGELFYVAAGNADAKWAGYIREDPRVRLRLGEDLYELSATLTNDEAELEAFLSALKRKYDFVPSEEQRDKAAVFRLEPRP